MGSYPDTDIDPRSHCFYAKERTKTNFLQRRRRLSLLLKKVITFCPSSVDL